jgi:transposase-like protein
MHPDNIMTDQEQAIGNAISDIFPASIHRNCIFHVIQLAKKHLGPLLVEGNPFVDALYSCIYGTNTPEQFEIC